MEWIEVIKALGILGAIGIVFGIILGVAAKKFSVEVDERVSRIKECLGGANCGGCGYAGCDAFAAAVVEGNAKPDGCPAGGNDTAQRIADIMGLTVEESEPKCGKILCQGNSGVAKDRYVYDGFVSCRAASTIAGGTKECYFACIGLGDCVKKCSFNAISILDGVAVIDPNRCKACGECIQECPRGVIALLPKSATVVVRCRNKEGGRVAKDACMKACIGCRRCTKECEPGAITVENNLASVDYEKCTRCGKCAAVCPCGCIEDLLKKGNHDA